MDAREIKREFLRSTRKQSINAKNRRGYVTQSMIDSVRGIASVTQPKPHSSGKTVLRKAA